MLLDEKMLPKIKVRSPQMEDLLQAEQAYLDVVLELLQWLHDRMVLISEVVMNIPNLRAKIKQVTGWDCEILEDAEHLTLTIRYYFDAQAPALEQEKEILKYVPAHLKVIHEFLQSYGGSRRLFTGTGLGAYVRYIGKPQETNGKRFGTDKIPLQSGVYVHTRTIIYPEGRKNDR